MISIFRCLSEVGAMMTMLTTGIRPNGSGHPSKSGIISKSCGKDIISIDKESANEQWAKRIGSNYQPYWIKQ